MKQKIMLFFALIAITFITTACSSSLNSGTPVGKSVTESGNTKTFVLTGENFKFLMNGQEAPELKVKQGDLVRIEFSSTDGFHDWVVDEFDAATEKVQTGGSTIVEFVASKTGTFEYYCSVGEHRANGMKGSLVVE